VNGVGDDIYLAVIFSKSELPYGLHRNATYTNIGTPSYIDLDYTTITTGDGMFVRVNSMNVQVAIGSN
jgi:hypothetical protein